MWYSDDMNKLDITLVLGVIAINAITVLSLAMILA